MKKLLSILLMFIIVFSFSINVFAEEEEDYNTYNINIKCPDSVYNSGQCTVYEVQGQLTLPKRYLIASHVYSSEYVNYFVYDTVNKEVYTISRFLSNVFHYVPEATFTGYSRYYVSRIDVGEIFEEKFYKEELEVDVTYDIDKGFYGRSDWMTYSVSIPLFESEAQVYQYFNGEIDITQAENYESDILYKVKDSNEVPMPRNLHIEHEDYRYYLIWEYSTEDLKKISSVSVNGVPKGIEIAIRNSGEYVLVPDGEYTAELDSCIEIKENLEPRLSYKLDITDDIMRLRGLLEEQHSVKYDYRAIVDYRILAHWDKSEFERYFSNIAHVKLYISDSDEGFKVDFDTSVTDSQNNVLDDVIFDSGIDIGTDSSNFIGNITNLFGLLGENGFLSCCKAIFSCFPSFVWDLISGGLSAALVVFLIKLLFK